MSGPITMVLVSKSEGYLEEFHIAYISTRMVLWAPPPITINGNTWHAREEPIGTLYGVKPDKGSSPEGFFFVDKAGNGSLFEKLAEARADLAVTGRA